MQPYYGIIKLFSHIIKINFFSRIKKDKTTHETARYIFEKKGIIEIPKKCPKGM